MGVLRLALIEQCHSCFYGNTPGMLCPCLDWQERTRTHTYPKLDTESRPVCVDADFRFMLLLCARVASISLLDCWNPFSSAACRPWTHKVHQYTSEQRLQMDCSSHCALGASAGCVSWFVLWKQAVMQIHYWFATFQTCHLQLKSVDDTWLEILLFIMLYLILIIALFLRPHETGVYFYQCSDAAVTACASERLTRPECAFVSSKIVHKAEDWHNS